MSRAGADGLHRRSAQNADHLGHNDCFSAVFVEVVCDLGACCCRRPSNERVGVPVDLVDPLDLIDPTENADAPP